MVSDDDDDDDDVEEDDGRWKMEAVFETTDEGNCEAHASISRINIKSISDERDKHLILNSGRRLSETSESAALTHSRRRK